MKYFNENHVEYSDSHIASMAAKFSYQQGSAFDMALVTDLHKFELVNEETQLYVMKPEYWTWQTPLRSKYHLTWNWRGIPIWREAHFAAK